MRFVSKLFLFLAIALWIVGYTRLGSVLHGIPEPLAVIFFGLFLITWAFPRKIFEQFDQDQALRNQLIRDERKNRRRLRRERSRVHWKAREVHS